MTRVSWSWGLVLALVGCIGTAQRTNRLYEDPNEAVSGVAKLVGDVGTVDGRSVADLGNTFELPAKCHVVTNVTEWGGHDASQAVMAKLPALSFAIEMKADYTYVVQIRMAGDSELVIEAIEKDGTGQVTRHIEPGGVGP